MPIQVSPLHRSIGPCYRWGENMQGKYKRMVERIRGVSCRVGLISVLWFGGGCATPASRPAIRPFDFSRDVLAITNELVWVYRADPLTGKMTHVTRESPPA